MSASFSKSHHLQTRSTTTEIATSNETHVSQRSSRLNLLHPRNYGSLHTTTSQASHCWFGSSELYKVNLLPDWAMHKALLKRLYLDQGRSLKDVMEIMGRDHKFSATVNMYKKKFKQWNWKKNTKREHRSTTQSATAVQRRVTPPFADLTNGGSSSMQSTALVLRPSSAVRQVPRQIGDPIPFRLPELAIRAINEHVSKCLRSLLPKCHAPVTSLSEYVPVRDDMLELGCPRSLIRMSSSIVSGMGAVSTGKITTSGAFFEKGFDQVEAVVRTNFVNIVLPILFLYRDSLFRGHQQIGQMLVSQMRKMAAKLHGQDNVHVHWMTCLLRMPEATTDDIILLLATSYLNAMTSILGPYHLYSMQTRAFVLQIKSNIDPLKTGPEWEELIADFRSLPESRECDRLIRDTLVYYAQSLVKVLKDDYGRAEIVLQDFVVWLHKATPDLGYGIFGIVAGTELYALSLARQGKDVLAESTYRFLIRRTIELVGTEKKDHVLLLECKMSFAAFLTERGRQEEMDHIYGEVNKELEAFMLAEKL